MPHATHKKRPQKACHNSQAPTKRALQTARQVAAKTRIPWQQAFAKTKPKSKDQTLVAWASRYLHQEVRGVLSPHTLEAKTRDLAGFIQWFEAYNDTGDHHGDISAWTARDTQVYLAHLERVGRAAASINRVLATLRRLAHWLMEQPGGGGIFAAQGSPLRGVRQRALDEPDCKKLGTYEIHALFKAADARVNLAHHATARPRRNRAILAMLYYTGLRVSELVALRRTQLVGHHLLDVKRKGLGRSKRVYLVAACRHVVDDYLTSERPLDDPQARLKPLFVAAKSQRPLTRQMISLLLKSIAAQASLGRKQAIHLHPHKLRHTFAALFRGKTGSDTETAAALGHVGLRYVGRYVRKTQRERERDLEEVFAE